MIGVGAVSVGSAAVLGSGSVSQAETQRRTNIRIAPDSNAYVQIEDHPDTNWSGDGTSVPTEFTVEEDAEGHLGILIDAVKNGTRTSFDNVFRVCNAGKQCACVWIDRKVGEFPERVTFFDSATGNSIEDPEDAVSAKVGECVSIGMEVDAMGLQDRNKLLDSITVNADANRATTVNGECECSNGESAWCNGTEFPGANWFMYYEYTGGDSTTDLVVGRSKTKIGEVTVMEAGGDEIEVTYRTDVGSDWNILETALAVGDEEPETDSGNEWIDKSWMNRAGNPVPGQFPVKEGFSYPGVDEGTYTVDIGDKEYPVYVGAHAVVSQGGN